MASFGLIAFTGAEAGLPAEASEKAGSLASV
jgi:hypothetical protein